MISRIGNKTYNTDVSRIVGTVSEPDGFSESLYRTRSGLFFLYREGGDESHYARRITRKKTDVLYDIVPLSYEEAKTWCSEHIGYEPPQEFVQGDQDKSTVSTRIVRCNDESMTMLERLSSDLGVTKSDVINLAIAKLYEDHYQS